MKVRHDTKRTRKDLQKENTSLRERLKLVENLNKLRGIRLKELQQVISRDRVEILKLWDSIRSLKQNMSDVYDV